MGSGKSNGKHLVQKEESPKLPQSSNPHDDGKIFPFIGSSEEQCVLAFSHLHGTEHVPPMLVRMLTFLRSTLQGNLISSVASDSEKPHPFKSVVVLRDGRTLLVDSSPPFIFLFSAGGSYTHSLTQPKPPAGETATTQVKGTSELGEFTACSGVAQLTSGRIVVADSRSACLQCFTLPKGDKALPIYHSRIKVTSVVPSQTDLGHLTEIDHEVVLVVDRTQKNLNIVDFGNPEDPTVKKAPIHHSTPDWSPHSVTYLRRTNTIAVCNYLDNSIWLLQTDGTVVTKLKDDFIKLSPTSLRALPSDRRLRGKFVHSKKLSYPTSLTTTQDGQLIVCDQGNQRLIVVDPEEQEVTLVIDTSQLNVKSLTGVSVVPTTGGVVVADQIGKMLHYFV